MHVVGGFCGRELDDVQVFEWARGLTAGAGARVNYGGSCLG